MDAACTAGGREGSPGGISVTARDQVSLAFLRGTFTAVMGPSGLVRYPPKVALASLVNSLKGVASRRLPVEFTGRVNRAIMHGWFWSPPTSPVRAAACRSKWSRTTSHWWRHLNPTPCLERPRSCLAESPGKPALTRGRMPRGGTARQSAPWGMATFSNLAIVLLAVTGRVDLAAAVDHYRSPT